MAIHKLALIIKNPSDDLEFLLIKQARPPRFNDPEYDSYVDSDLWDLPCAELIQLSENLSPLNPQINIETDDQSSSEIPNFGQFDINSALTKISEQVGFGVPNGVKWRLWKCVEEPEFGPGMPVKVVYIVGKFDPEDLKLKELCKWMSVKTCLHMLVEVKPGSDRVGPLLVIGVLNNLMQTEDWKVPSGLRFQEYPPGAKVVPMLSRTTKPFRTTNLVVFLPRTSRDGNVEAGDPSFVAHGDALIVDPGCTSALHEELKEIVDALPRKLLVFVTHHHHDHVDGLSTVQKCKPDAVLLAHENTRRRIGKDDWSRRYLSVSGSEEICVGGERLRIIAAPGHTDGHMALLHVSTHSLIVGDHCLGQGSATLDITSGGNMSEYFKTTYKFMDLAPHALIPMHGRVNMWPQHMLCGYLKNRRNRELTILKAIENGAKTLFDIVAYTYADVDRSFWIIASSNVRLHVDHLAQRGQLPEEFCVEKFKKTCKLHFLCRWMWEYLTYTLTTNHQKLKKAKVISAVTIVGFALLYSFKNNPSPK